MAAGSALNVAVKSLSALPLSLPVPIRVPVRAAGLSTPPEGQTGPRISAQDPAGVPGRSGSAAALRDPPGDPVTDARLPLFLLQRGALQPADGQWCVGGVGWGGVLGSPY